MEHGYRHADYAGSLRDLGTPVPLIASGGWLLSRDIPESSHGDLMGPYPIFCCQDWTKLRADLDTLARDHVCVSLVTDPFGEYTRNLLENSFRHVARPFKEHFVTDLSQTPALIVSAHNARNARKALGRVEVDYCESPEALDDDWRRLYANLVRRHDIRGFAAFSDAALTQQLRVPGMLAFRARHEGETVGMVLWYVMGEVCYYHLGAYTDVGYNLNASFGLFWKAIEHFQEAGRKWLALGAGAGRSSDSDDGLSRFKRGWSTGTRTAYFCGRILDPVRYAELVTASGHASTSFFPAYRYGEVG